MPTRHEKRIARQKKQGTPDFTEGQLKAIGQRVSLSTPATGIARITLAANLTVTSEPYVDIPGLSFAVAAGQLYMFELHAPFAVNSTSYNPDFSFTGPASPTRFFYNYNYPQGSQMLNRCATTYDFADGAYAVSTSSNMAILWGFIVPSANGTLKARAAIRAGGVLTVLAGSTLGYR